jgi:hypothetical protein
MRDSKTKVEGQLMGSSPTMPGLPTLVKRLLGVSALGVGCIAISVAVVKLALIPEQLNWIAPTGPVVVALAIVIAHQTNDVSRRLMTSLSVLMSATLVTLIILHSTLVVDIDLNKSPVSYLVGWHLAPDALRSFQACHSSFSSPSTSIDPRKLFSCAGPDMIPQAYGWSYTLAYALYALTYLGLVSSFAFVIAVAIMRQS